MRDSVVITGIGMVTPLGAESDQVLRRVVAGESAATEPDFDVSAFGCKAFARVNDFRPHDYITEPKMLRLMNREAQLAVAAARLAILDAGLQVGIHYKSEEIGVFGAVGLAGLPLREVMPLLQASVGASGQFDLKRFGEAGLRAVNPLFAFRILGNMPVCFVSICENIQGPNAIYTPWEGQGAQAIEAGLRALEWGDARCVLVGGSDVKTHELAFLTLEQLGLFDSWRETGKGLAPGEGAIYLVLESEISALARQARVHARVVGWSVCTNAEPLPTSAFAALRKLRLSAKPLACVVAAANGIAAWEQAETEALSAAGIESSGWIYPKKCAGDLFAAAATLQVALAALLAAQAPGSQVLANCFGYGSEQAAFELEKP